MTEFLSDLRLGLRLLTKSPVFTLTTALLLAVGISANTLIFSLVDALLLKPLPVSHPENLVRIVEVHPNNFITWDLPYKFCDDVPSRDPDFSDVLCQGEADLPFTDGAVTERVRVHLVSPNFFSSLQVAADLGRVLNPEDERTVATNAVLSYDFWKRRFQGEALVIGRSVTLGGHAFTIVGVSPQAFNGLTIDTSPDLRVPLSTARLIVKPLDGIYGNGTPLFGQVFARLRPGAPFDRANKEVDARLHQTLDDEVARMFPPVKGQARPDSRLQSHVHLESVANGVSTLRAQFSHGLEALMAGVALLLLLACANVAGLLLARSAARSQEFGMRIALGATRARIVGQVLAEALPLALLGGLLGILFTPAGLPLLIRALPPIRDRGAVIQSLAVHIDLDVRVLAFALAITLLTTILFGLSPALQSSRVSLAGARTTRKLQARNLIVAAQVALCTLLLIGAAVLIETFEHMRSMNPGFDADRVVTFTIDPSLRGYTQDQSRALSKALLEKARALPGVSAASIAGRGLMRGTGVKATFGAAGSRITDADFLNTSLNNVTPGYFETMGMRLLAGRDFNWFDHNRSVPNKAIVNRAFVSRFFPGREPLGQHFGGAGPGGIATVEHEIAGVVSDAKYRSLREPIPPTVYTAAVDGFEFGFILHLRTRQNPEALIGPVRQLLHGLDPELPFIEVRTLREEVDASLWQERLLAWFSTVFAAIAALLAGIGLYGALDYAVKSRTREIGVRVALGAGPAQIARLLGGQTLLLLASGLALGLCAYAAGAIWIGRGLYEVRPWEPVAVASVLILVTLVAAAASAPATLRAIRNDPASALRTE